MYKCTLLLCILITSEAKPGYQACYNESVCSVVLYSPPMDRVVRYPSRCLNVAVYPILLISLGRKLNRAASTREVGEIEYHPCRYA